MPTTIHPTRSIRDARSGRSPAEPAFGKPLYDCQEQDGIMRLTVFVPGVDASGVSIEARGPDLWVTARRSRYVRVNWQALHLEPSRLDYRLNLRLGRGYAYEAMDAQIGDGVLTITLPKRTNASGRLPAEPPSLRCVA